MHPRHPAEIPLQPLYQIGGVYYGMDSVVVVQIGEVGHAGGILAALAEDPVILAPLGAEPLPFLPGLLHGAVPVPRTDDLPQVVRHIALVPVADIAQQVAPQVDGAPLELGPGKDLADDLLQPFEAVRADEAYLADAPLVQVLQHLAPANGALGELVEDAQHLPGLVLLHRQSHVEGFRIHAPLAVNLDMHAVDEHTGQ